jgi:rhodanese-related sulfurtransferase
MSSQSGSGVRDLTPQEVAQGMKDGRVVLVDVREPNETAVERFPGAVLVPLSAFDPVAIPAPPACEVVFACRSGRRASGVEGGWIQNDTINLALAFPKAAAQLRHGFLDIRGPFLPFRTVVAIDPFERLRRHSQEPGRLPDRHLGPHHPRCTGVTHGVRRDALQSGRRDHLAPARMRIRDRLTVEMADVLDGTIKPLPASQVRS